jgi:phage-related protein
MTDYNDDTDYSGTYTSVIPYWTGSDDSGDVIVKANRTDSGLPSYNGRNDCIPLDLSDKFEDKPTTAQLQQMALQMMASQNPNMPSQSISVSFIRLQDSAEYAYLAPLLQCRLCDTVKVEFPRYGMS